MSDVNVTSDENTANDANSLNNVRAVSDNVRSSEVSSASNTSTQEVWTVFTSRKVQVTIFVVRLLQRETFISKFHRDTNYEGLKTYITEKDVTDFNRTLMSKANAIYKSYKVTVSIADKDNNS